MDNGFRNNNFGNEYGNYNGGFRNNGFYGDVTVQSAVSDKSKGVAILLCFFFGWIGFHRFYIGRTGTGVAMLLMGMFGAATSVFFIGIPFLVIVGIIEVIDFFRLLLNGLTDGQGRKLR